MRRVRGLTLLEQIISLTLLGLVIIFMLNLLPNTIALHNQAVARNQASKLARSLLEREAALPFTSLTTGSQAQYTYGNYQATLSILPVPQTDPAHLLDLQVSVTWQERGAQRILIQDLWVHNLRS